MTPVDDRVIPDNLISRVSVKRIDPGALSSPHAAVESAPVSHDVLYNVIMFFYMDTDNKHCKRLFSCLLQPDIMVGCVQIRWVKISVFCYNIFLYSLVSKYLRQNLFLAN